MTDNRNLHTLTAEEEEELERWAPPELCQPGTCSEHGSSWLSAKARAIATSRTVCVPVRPPSRVGKPASNEIGWRDWKVVIRAADHGWRRLQCRRAWCGGYSKNRTLAAPTGPAGRWPAS